MWYNLILFTPWLIYYIAFYIIRLYGYIIRKWVFRVNQTKKTNEKGDASSAICLHSLSNHTHVTLTCSFTTSPSSTLRLFEFCGIHRTFKHPSSQHHVYGVQSNWAYYLAVPTFMETHNNYLLQSKILISMITKHMY